MVKHSQIHNNRKLKVKCIFLNFLTVSFYFSLFLLFLFGGGIALTGHIPFRPKYLVIIWLLTLLLKSNIKIKINKNTVISFLCFLFVVIVSIFKNDVQINGLVFYLLNLSFPIITFLFMSVYHEKNKERLENILIFVAYIQLPVILFQFKFYHLIIKFSFMKIGFFDIGFGTFYLSCDSAMSFFMVCMLIKYLLEKNNSRENFVRSLYFSVTLFIAGAQVFHLLVIIIWLYWLISNRNQLKMVLLFFLFLSISFYGPKLLTFISVQENPAVTLFTKSSLKNDAINRFKAGKYSRSGALYYYFSKSLSFFGDGPGRYYNPINKEFKLGIHGHFLYYYAEVGLLGLFLSYFIIFTFIRYKEKENYFIYGAFLVASLTVNLFTNASILFVYALFQYVIFAEDRITNVQNAEIS